MIHPIARFSAIPSAGESLWERAALLERPAAEFAAFLKEKTTAVEVPAGSDTPQRAASSIAVLPPLPPVASPNQGVEPPPLPQNTEAAPLADAAGPVRFQDVPDSAKYPAGPYRQAPAEYGGEWWLVNPFTGDEPWLNHQLATVPEAKYATENLPDDFLMAFGGKPVRREGEAGADLVARVARWRQDLEYFERTGIPEGFDEDQVQLASAAFEQWGMGRPVFYEGRYGWFARFPESEIPEFEMDAATTIQTSHLAIARFHVRLLREGMEVPAPHPFVPPHLFEQNV
jgi:hypothetical protein